MKTPAARRRALLALGSVLSAFVLPPSAFPQGALTPPGLPAPTMKTLAQIEPRTLVNAVNTPGNGEAVFVISQPGSYSLEANLLGVTGKNGILITTSDVTLDLNGLELVGVPQSKNGIFSSVNGLQNIVVRNGTVRAWASDGVNLFGTTGSRCEGVRSNVNVGRGIFVSFSGAVIDCTALTNGSIGISPSEDCVVRGCTAGGNSIGISTAGGATVAECTAVSNSSDGIRAGSGSTVTGCTASSNGLNGIRVSQNCRVSRNLCNLNGTAAATGAGIYATSTGNRLEGNTTRDNDRGIDVDGAGNLILGNFSAGNTGTGSPSANFDIATGNGVGPILSAAGVASNTNPGANFGF